MDASGVRHKTVLTVFLAVILAFFLVPAAFAQTTDVTEEPTEEPVLEEPTVDDGEPATEEEVDEPLTEYALIDADNYSLIVKFSTIVLRLPAPVVDDTVDPDAPVDGDDGATDGDDTGEEPPDGDGVDGDGTDDPDATDTSDEFDGLEFEITVERTWNHGGWVSAFASSKAEVDGMTIKDAVKADPNVNWGYFVSSLAKSGVGKELVLAPEEEPEDPPVVEDQPAEPEDPEPELSEDTDDEDTDGAAVSAQKVTKSKAKAKAPKVEKSKPAKAKASTSKGGKGKKK